MTENFPTTAAENFPAMMPENANKFRMHFFERFSTTVTKVTGSTPAFIMACALVVIWALTGPVFHYSENWQLVINTGTTIITFDGFFNSEIAEQRFPGHTVKTQRAGSGA